MTVKRYFIIFITLKRMLTADITANSVDKFNMR